MTLISDDYLQQNRDLHEKAAGYGAGSWKWVGVILAFAKSHNAASVLDYGAGKCNFAKWWRQACDIDVQSYDPATVPARPQPAGLILCTDVLEHIEPDHVDAVVADIAGLLRPAGRAFILISTREARKVLPDGRNAHLIVEGAQWWEDTLSESFEVTQNITIQHPELCSADEVLFLCGANDGNW